MNRADGDAIDVARAAGHVACLTVLRQHMAHFDLAPAAEPMGANAMQPQQDCLVWPAVALQVAVGTVLAVCSLMWHAVCSLLCGTQFLYGAVVQSMW